MDFINLKGTVRIELFDGCGKRETTVDNMVVNIALNKLASVLAYGSSATAGNAANLILKAISVGSGNSTTYRTTTGLDSEIDRIDVASASVVQSDDKYNVSVYSDFDTLHGNGSINELGLYSYDGSAYQLFSRAVLSEPVVKSSQQTMRITWTISIG